MAKRLRVLVVDDDKSICRWLDAVLTDEGYTPQSRRWRAPSQVAHSNI